MPSKDGFERCPLPYLLFAAGMAAATLALRQRKQSEKPQKPKETTTTSTTSHRHRVDGKKGHVSTRGGSNLAAAMDYLADFFACLDDLCHPVTNPKGHIPVVVAENRLVTDLLHTRLTTLETAKAGFDHRDVYSYNDPQGLPIFRQALASLFQERFLKQKPNGKPNPIDPNHITVGAGAINILSSLFFALGSSGDAVLVPAPYYAAFDNDLRAFAGCQTIPVHCENPAEGPSVLDLERARVKAEQSGFRVRFLLLTHPHNPLGVVYKPQVMKDAIGWARSHDMDTVVDEIYALSVFDKKEEFQSIVQLYNNNLGNDLHLVWGLSKDFGASGFRVGVLYTQNELLMEAIGNLTVFAWPSLPMQSAMAALLSDKAWVESFLAESCRRLKRSYTICTNVLDNLQIPYIPATAAMFLYFDLSELIHTPEQEAMFSRLLMKRARLVPTPGLAQHDPQPGKFRICYAYVSAEVLQIGMQRFEKVVAKVREQGGLGDWIEEDKDWQDVL